MRRASRIERRGVRLALLAALLALAGCGSVPLNTPAPAAPRPAPSARPAQPEAGVPHLPAAGSGRGGYYQDDGPGENPPPNLASVPDAEPRVEPLVARANRPYVVLGKTYTPLTDDRPYSERGLGTWYGKKFHGQRTSSGEPYDMYKMTAAHPVLPIPSYARVTNVDNGKTVVVRINDRGPFHSSRVIDVSYTAALKLGLLANGSSELLVERLLPGDIEWTASARGRAAPAAASTGVALADGASGKGSIYLQLGAYLYAENAEAERARLAGGNPVAGLEVVRAGSVYRLFSGPFASREHAAQAAQALAVGRNLKPIVVER